MSGTEAVVSGHTTSNLFTHTITYGGTRNYTVCYNPDALTTYWVAYPLNSSYMGSAGRNEEWAYVDSDLLPTNKQVNVVDGSFYSWYNNKDDKGTNNYSKGHLVPSNSRTSSVGMNKQTFLSVNIAPQHQNSFNGGVWNALEGKLQTLATTQQLFIVTGTMCQSIGDGFSTSDTYDTSGKKIPAPRYFYKVVLKVDDVNNPTSASAIGFWYTNEAHIGNYYDANYVKSVDQIEAWTGLDFFVNLPDSIEENAESNTNWSAFQSF